MRDEEEEEVRKGRTMGVDDEDVVGLTDLEWWDDHP